MKKCCEIGWDNVYKSFHRNFIYMIIPLHRTLCLQCTRIYWPMVWREHTLHSSFYVFFIRMPFGWLWFAMNSTSIDAGGRKGRETTVGKKQKTNQNSGQQIEWNCIVSICWYLSICYLVLFWANRTFLVEWHYTFTRLTINATLEMEMENENNDSNAMRDCFQLFQQVARTRQIKNTTILFYYRCYYSFYLDCLCRS